MIRNCTFFFLLTMMIPFWSFCQKTPVAFICEKPIELANKETSAAYDFLKNDQKYEPVVILWSDLSKSLKNFSLAWVHSENIPKSNKEINKLKVWVNDGGKLLLSLDAFKLIIPLCNETGRITDSIKSVNDDGYGRRAGLHAFLDHPVFKGMNGGAYLLRPIKDTTFRISGFFGSDVPDKGMVIAADWDYIFLREKSKLLVEYQVGAGRIIASGAYINFAVPNRNYAHLVTFTKNIFDYLLCEICKNNNRPWSYKTALIKECDIPQTDILVAKAPDSKLWNIPENSLNIESRYASENFWDVAGERMLTMGIEKAGIEEVWSHPFMAFRDYEVGIRFTYRDTVFWLKDERPEIIVSPSCFTRNYKFPRAYLKEIITNSPSAAQGVVHYEYDGVYDAELIIKFRSNLRLMWPYPENTTGDICYKWNGDLDGLVFGDENGHSVMAGANRPPEKHEEGKSEDNSGIKAGMTYKLKMTDMMDFMFVAGTEGIEPVIGSFRELREDPGIVFRESASKINDLLNNSLIINTPDENFNKGYKWSLIATDRFFVNTPGMGSSLVAGYSTTRKGWDGGQKISGRPGYGWYFGRDGAWSGFALLGYGDFDKVRSMLEFYLKYQDLSGKIFHEATTSGVIHYDASDATPLFIILCGRYFRHSNDKEFIVKNWNGIKKAIDFCFSTDTDNDHLIENTNVGHGWVEGGELYGSDETIYMAGCWNGALEEAYIMASAIEDPEAESYKNEALLVRESIMRNFFDKKTSFPSYGINKDKTQRTEPTILPAVPLYFRAIRKEAAYPVLTQYASNAFSTNWGTRILRNDSKLFKPAGYHYGSVWPLFTGWASLAEFTFGNNIQGFSHIMNNLNIYKNWGLGFTEEVLNGEVYQPSGVCPHQCWSETMVLQPAIEGMLGFDVNTALNKIYLAPRIPSGWDSLTVTNLRVDHRKVSFSMHRQDGKYIYKLNVSGDPLNVEFMPSLPSGTKIIEARLNGKLFQINSFSTQKSVILAAMMTLSGENTLEVEFKKGVSVLPLLSDPKPGDQAEGCRIINYGLEGNNYFADLESLPGTEETISFYVKDQEVAAITNGTVISSENNILKVKVIFEKEDRKYSTKRITISFR